MSETTRIQDPNGNLLWSPVNPNGQYSLKKAETIAEVLENLIDSIEIKAKITMDEDQLANVYTKTQSDERFVLVSNADALITGKVSELIISGQIAGMTDINTINSRLLTVWKSCYGTNFDGVQVQNTSYNQSIDSLENSVYANTQDILRVLNSLYAKNPDGSTIDFSKVLFAAVSDVGTTSDLSAAFSGTNRSKLVNAINYVYSLINNRNEIIGTGSLQTQAQTLISAVNELLGLNNTSNQTIVTLSGSVSNIASSVSALTESIADTKTSYNQMNSRVTAIETLDGTGSLNTADKTLIGGINELKSELANDTSEISSMKSDVTQIKSDISSLRGQASTIGSLNNLDSLVSASNLVSSINKVVELISGLDSRLSSIESKIENIESSITSFESSIEGLDIRVSALENAE